MIVFCNITQNRRADEIFKTDKDIPAAGGILPAR